MTDYKEKKQMEELVNSIVRRNVPESLSVGDRSQKGYCE